MKVTRQCNRLLPAVLFLFAVCGWMSNSNSADPKIDAAQACPSPGTPVVEPYRWYPLLDLARVPFHTASGPWGPRAPIAAPAPPATTRTVRVTSASQLAAAALVPGTLIVVDAEYVGNAVVFGDVTDIDIVVPRGRTVGQLIIGRYTPPSTTRRVRIRGTTPGSHSGGLLGHISFASSLATDIIIDGVDLNGANGRGGSLLWAFGGGVERAAVVNIRGHGVGSASLYSHTHGVIDVVIAGNRIMSGARPREVNGYLDGWGVRGGDRIVIYDNRIDGTRYHRVRMHPKQGTQIQYAWVANNTFIDSHEARIFSVFSIGAATKYSGVWAICNRVYAHSRCMPPSFEAPDAQYAMLTHNTFFGSITEAGQRIIQTAHGAGRDYLTGNTFSPWQAPPQWDGSGDPTITVPLPPQDSNRYNAALAFQPCPPP